MMHKYDAPAPSLQTPLRASSKTTCAVVGARGYSGLELIKILLHHPEAALLEAFASKSFSLSQEIEDPLVAAVRVAGEDEVLDSQAEVIFLATPAEVSLKLVPELLQKKKLVVDLSGAFRLQDHPVENWYPFAVPAELLKQAHYGLVPFAEPFTRGKTSFISNPGCYATAVQMALIPLLKRGLVDTQMIVIDAKSGTSGAGRKAQEGMLFSEVEGDLRPYRIGRHQHQPEILEGLSKMGAPVSENQLFFSTQLLPVRHGIQAGIYLKSRTSSLREIEQAYEEAFASYPLAQWGQLESKPQLADLTRVVGSPQTRLSFELRGDKLFLFSCLDNRWKGAASQAVENFNIAMDRPVATGLI